MRALAKLASNRTRAREDREVIRGGLGVRSRFLLITIVCFAPIVAFTVILALQRAEAARDTLSAATWVAVAGAPLLIAAAAVVAVWTAADYFIIRWLIYLERLADAYARGRYSLRASGLEHAPTELRWLGAAVDVMARAVQTRDEALRKSLDQQTLLLREVHHRVKNNLQIVGSLLGLQTARTQSPEVRQALTEALVRFDALALVQRFMEDCEDAGRCDAPELFVALASQLRVRLSHGTCRLRIETHVEAHEIALDSVSPLVLIATEAVLLAYRRCASPEALIVLSLDGETTAPRLCIRAANDDQAFVQPNNDISDDLLNGYARRLRARLDRTSQPGALMVIVPQSLAA